MQLDVSCVGTRRCLGPGAIATHCGLSRSFTGSFTREAPDRWRLHLAFGAALALSRLPRRASPSKDLPLPDLPPLPPLPGQNSEDDQDLSDDMDEEYEDQSDQTLETSPSTPPLPPLVAGRARSPSKDLPLPDLPPLPPLPGQNSEDDQDLSDDMDEEYEDQSDQTLETSPSTPPLPPLFAGRARAEARDDANDNGYNSHDSYDGSSGYDGYDGHDGGDNTGDMQLKGVEPQQEAVPVKLLGPTAKAFVQDSSRREKSREFYMLQPEDDGPRPLSWEEARIDFLPVGETVRGVVEEIRPYGSFIGLVVCGMAVGRFGEDSQIRGFCEELQLTDGWVSPQVGQQVAVKILSIDEMKRVHLSISQATPPWPPREERVLHSPEKYEDPDFFPLP